MLLESKILDAKQETKLNKLLDQGNARKAALLIARVLKQSYPKQYERINAEGSRNYLSDVIQSIIKDGVDTDTNTFLKFALNPRTVKIDATTDQIRLIKKCMDQSLINAEKAWLYDKKAYNGESDFKLKSLIFLSSRKAESSYDKQALAEVIEKILKTTNDADIKRYVTRDLKKTDTTTQTFSKEQLQHRLEKELEENGKVSGKLAKDIFQNGFEIIKDSSGHYQIQPSDNT